MQQLLQVLKLAEQAFLVFLEDEQEAFHTITQHAAKRRALKDQSSSSRHARTSESAKDQLPNMKLQAAHGEIIHQMVQAMNQLPGGDAGRHLSAIAALLGDPPTNTLFGSSCKLGFVRIFNDLHTPLVVDPVCLSLTHIYITVLRSCLLHAGVDDIQTTP